MEPIFAEGIETKVFFCFCGTHFCEGPGVPWTLGLQSNPTWAYKCWSFGLWDCNPILRRHTNVDQLNSGITVHGTDMHQQESVLDASTFCLLWFGRVGLSSPQEKPSTRGFYLSTTKIK